MGAAQISQAAELARHGQRREALVLARAGVARAPAHRAGRLLLAQLLLEAGRADAAVQTLLEGIPFARDDAKYLHALFTVLLRLQHDDRVLTLARSLLPRRPANSERDRLVGLAAATACFFRGEFDQAEDFLNLVPALASSRDGRLLAAKIDWARGYRDLALVSLRAQANEWPHDAELNFELLQRLRERGLRDEARRVSLAYQIAHPALARARLELLRDLRESAEPARAAREVEAFVRDFATDADALLALADFAANSAEPALVRRLFDHARTNDLAWEPHALLLVEAHIAARDYRAALAAADEFARDHPDFATRFTPVLNSLRAIAHYGLAEPARGQLFLASCLNQPSLRADHLLAIAQRLTAVDAAGSAHDALARAIVVEPRNQAALTRLVELDLNLNRLDELPAHLLRLVAMRQPSPDILRVAHHKLGSDLFLFSAERPAALAAVRAALDKQTPPRPRL